MPDSQLPIQYAPEDFLKMFEQPSFGFLPQGLKIILDEVPPAQGRIPQRCAQIRIEDATSVILRILPYGFTKPELFEVRESFEHLTEGTQVQIAGNIHTIALFFSCMRMEDHQVEQIDLEFEIDPFAE
jgi:hypothetical protein